MQRVTRIRLERGDDGRDQLTIAFGEKPHRTEITFYGQLYIDTADRDWPHPLTWQLIMQTSAADPDSAWAWGSFAVAPSVEPPNG